MSKRINVNPDHYKVAGRERQGENVVHSTERRTLARLRRQERLIHPVVPAAPVQTGPAGISNRESSDAEALDRRDHPPLERSSPPPEDAAGRVGEEPLDDRRDRHTSHKAGSRSIAQKEAGARYPDRSMPAARKVAGAFGREPQRIPSFSNDSSGAIRRARPRRATKGKRPR
jgi:hypothetical protein